MPGPVPKRTDLRRNRNAKSGPELVQAEAGAELTWPEPDEAWGPVACQMYAALQASGQAQFYEQTDIAVATLTCELIDQVLLGRRGAAAIAAVVHQLLVDLLATEGARRRARVELVRGTGEPQENPLAIQLESYRRAAAGGAHD